MDYHFPELESTNSWMKQRSAELDNLAVVTADFQKAGRGQRGNGWESAPGENLLMSMFISPDDLSARNQFLISKMVSVSVAAVLERLLPGDALVRIKWPNDIYVNERKVCGILIENILGQNGRIQHSIIGIGLNVNQAVFLSGAPNPGSLIQFMPQGATMLTPREVGTMIRDEIAASLPLVRDGQTAFEEPYLRRLRGYRQFLRYAVLTPSAAPAPTALSDAAQHPVIEAEIIDVAPDGYLHTRLRDGSLRSFYFKEITPVIKG